MMQMTECRVKNKGFHREFWSTIQLETLTMNPTGRKDKKFQFFFVKN